MLSNSLARTFAAELVELALATGRQLAGKALEAALNRSYRVVAELLHIGWTDQPTPLVAPTLLTGLVQAHLSSEFARCSWKLCS